MSGDTPLRVSIRRYLIAFLGLGVLMLAAPRLAAQTAPVTGVPPLSTVQTLPEGVLNLGDLNLHVAVPDLPPVTGPGMRMTVPPFRLVLCGR
jgi:hypothetical protein